VDSCGYPKSTLSMDAPREEASVYSQNLAAKPEVPTQFTTHVKVLLRVTGWQLS
jgi:hypothetical protein